MLPNTVRATQRCAPTAKRLVHHASEHSKLPMRHARLGKLAEKHADASTKSSQARPFIWALLSASTVFAAHQLFFSRDGDRMDDDDDPFANRLRPKLEQVRWSADSQIASADVGIRTDGRKELEGLLAITANAYWDKNGNPLSPAPAAPSKSPTNPPVRYSSGLHPSSCAHMRLPHTEDSDFVDDIHDHHTPDRPVEEVVKEMEESTVVIEIAGFDPLSPPLSRGTGFLISSDGLALTNAHVVVDVAGSGPEPPSAGWRVTATDHSGRTYSASIHAVDPASDLALVRIHGSPHLAVTKDGSGKDTTEEYAGGWRPVVLGEASKIRPGAPLLTLGHPLGLLFTLSTGTCSHPPRPSAHVGRPDPRLRFLQTSTPLFPGSSGGPVFTPRGEVVGVATLRAAGGGGEGLSFAVGVDKAWRGAVRRMVCQGGKGEGLKRPFWGVEVDMEERPGSPGGAPGGAKVLKVLPGSPAYTAGLRAGDLVGKTDGYKVKDGPALVGMVGLAEPGSPVRCTVWRRVEGKRGEKDSAGEKWEQKTVTVVPGRAEGWGVVEGGL